MGSDGSGKVRRREVTSRNKDVAIVELRRLRALKETQGSIPTATTLLSVWLDEWLSQPRKPATRASYASLVKHQITPHLGKKRLHDLTPMDIRRWQKTLKGDISPSTALKAHRVLSSALSEAQRMGLTSRNVASLVPAPGRVRRDQSLTTEQARALIASLPDDDWRKTRFAAALLVGWRAGELLGLERDRVTDRLELSWQLQRLPHVHGCGGTCGRKRGGDCPKAKLDAPGDFEARPLSGGLYLTRPKTATSRRVVPLVEPLKGLLAYWLSVAPPNPHGLVWTRADGRPIDPKDDRAAWYAALDSAGIPRVTLHVARNTTATLLLEEGVDARVVQEILGHSDIAMSRAYQHVSMALAGQALTGLGSSLTAVSIEPAEGAAGDES
jgi:integrase